MSENTTQTQTQSVTKVEWLKHQLPAVNSKEYWDFRRSHEDLTHQEWTTEEVVKNVPRGTTRTELVKYITDRWDTDEIAKHNEPTEDRQVLQYLGQLTAKGWNRLLNQITTRLEMKD